MNRFTLLRREQLYGKSQLEVFKKIGVEAKLTDFDILTGAFICNISYDIRTDEVTYIDNYIKDLTGWYWTSNVNNNGNVETVSFNGLSGNRYCEGREGGIRPVLYYSSFSEILNKANRSFTNNGVLEIEYGYYPQTVASSKLQKELTDNFGKLKKTENTYTIDGISSKEYEKSFLPTIINEYEYNGKRYVRVKANSSFINGKFKLSNGCEYKNGELVWVEVQPVEWLVSKENDMLIAKNIVCSGVQYHNNTNLNNFAESNMHNYIDRYLFRDIFQRLYPGLNKGPYYEYRDSSDFNDKNNKKFNSLVKKLVRERKAK